MKKEDTHRIVIEENARYSESVYSTEKELETLAVKNKYALFGESTIYFDKKMLITSIAKLSKIPDGLFLAVNNRNDAKLWIVEYELSSHDLHSHIFPQITGFVQALRNESTKRILKESIYKTIRDNRESFKKIKSILPADDEVHHFLELIMDRRLGIVIVIDKKTPELEEVVDSISNSMNIENQILEFTTFENDKGKKIHILDVWENLGLNGMGSTWKNLLNAKTYLQLSWQIGTLQTFVLGSTQANSTMNMIIM